MDARLLFFCLLAGLPSAVAATDLRHTPEAGSPERQSICDGARAYVLKNYTTQSKLPQSIVFKIERIEVIGDFCSFEAIPRFQDGSPVSTDYIFDVVFDLCLKKTNHAWRVIYDFSRTDVPNDDELKQMWRRFPKDFPFTLLPEFWRDHFNRIK